MVPERREQRSDDGAGRAPDNHFIPQNRGIADFSVVHIGVSRIRNYGCLGSDNADRRRKFYADSDHTKGEDCITGCAVQAGWIGYQFRL